MIDDLLEMMLEAAKFLACILTPILIICLLIGIWLAGGIGSHVCAARWRDSGMPYRFSVSSGCQVKQGKFWFPEENVKVMK